MSRVKDKLINGVAVLGLLAGLGLLLYPTVADWWNTWHQTRIIGDYEQAVQKLGQREHDQILLDAERFNVQLASRNHMLILSDEEREAYYKLLDITDTGIMGYVSIPKMSVTIPIFHGTSDAVLTIGAGHLEGTSLPIGGVGTHASITAHRGLPRARLFSDLDDMAVGDRFFITVLDRTLTYEVDQVRVVLPDQIDDLAIDPEKDYFTLVTCTPYGVNSHRLLVRGHRVDGTGNGAAVLAEAVRLEPRYVAPILAIPVSLALAGWAAALWRVFKRRRREAAEARQGFAERQERRAHRSDPAASASSAYLADPAEPADQSGTS